MPPASADTTPAPLLPDALAPQVSLELTPVHPAAALAPPGAPPRPRLQPAGASPRVDIVVPVYNEAAGLQVSIRRLHRFLCEELPFAWRIVIADNASMDATPELARALAAELPDVTVLCLAEKGRGRALRAAWSASDAEVLAYMDVDLSTDLRALHPLIAALLSGHSEIAIGSRLAPGSRVVRGPKREFISRSYNHILRRRPARDVLRCAVRLQGDPRRRRPEAAAPGRRPGVVLRYRAARAGPARGDAHPRGRGGLDRRSRLARRHRRHGGRGSARRRPARLASPVTRFVLVGLASTLAYALLYLGLRATTAPGVANALALGRHRRSQYPGQPARHLRGARPRWSGSVTTRPAASSSCSPSA